MVFFYNSINSVLLPRRAPQLDIPERPLCHRTFLLSALSNHTRIDKLVEDHTIAHFHQHVIRYDSHNHAIRHSNALHNQESSQLTVNSFRCT